MISKGFNRKVIVTVGIIMMSVLFTLLLLNSFRVILLILAGILVAAFLVGISFALAPSISQQVSSLEEQLPRAADETFNKIEATAFGSFVFKPVKDMVLQPDSGQIKQLFGSLGGAEYGLLLFFWVFSLQLIPKPIYGAWSCCSLKREGTVPGKF